jgi:hypothetical protein
MSQETQLELIFEQVSELCNRNLFYWQLPQSYTLKIEAASPFETLATNHTSKKYKPNLFRSSKLKISHWKYMSHFNDVAKLMAPFGIQQQVSV